MENQAGMNNQLWFPACQACKIQDESLRVVSYPYVVSILVVTFQRAFFGIYCRKHQRWYHFLASLITSVAGWLGIPYGFILTPIVLAKLARGGILDTAANVQLLQSVADIKLQEGDASGAILCLEEILKLEDGAETRERLSKLYQLHRVRDDKDGLDFVWQVVSIPFLLLISASVGLVVALIDLLISTLLSPLFGEGGSILIAILSWIPIVTMMFFGILTVRAVTRWCVYKNKQAFALFGGFIAFVSTFCFFYSILEGRAIINTLQGVSAIFSISAGDGVFAIRSVLAHGGLDVLINSLTRGDLAGIIFVVLVSSGAGLSLFTNMETSLQTSNWQRRLRAIQESRFAEADSTSALAWGALGSMILGYLFILALIYPGRYVNIEKTFEEIQVGISELNQHDTQSAVRRFEAIANSWPNSVTGHFYLGIGYAAQDKSDLALQEFDEGLKLDENSLPAHLFRGYTLAAQSRYTEAINEFRIVVGFQPAWGLPHANLAALYYSTDRIEEAEREIQQAIELAGGDPQTLSTIAGYFALTQDLDRAEEFFLKAIETSTDPNDHVYLARIQMLQQNYDDAEKSIGEAERLGANPVHIYLSKIILAEYQGRMDIASALIAEAIESFPNDSNLYSEKSYLEFQQGHFDTAISDAEKAIELNPYNHHAYVELAYAYHSQGRLMDALEAAKKAAAAVPKYDRSHYILGLCYMDGGLAEEAIREFELFISLNIERTSTKGDRRNAEIYLEQLR